MKDVSKISKTLNEIEKIWNENPDLRLGQLILNLFLTPYSLYFVEDEDLVDKLKEYYK